MCSKGILDCLTVRKGIEKRKNQVMTIEEYNRSVDDFSDGLKRFVERMTMDNNLAEDIVQDVYEKIWRNLELVENKNLKAYLFISARQILINHLNREKKIKYADVNPDDEYEKTDPDSGLQEVLFHALSVLDPMQRMFLLMREYEGFEYEEIVTMTGADIVSIKKSLFRAKQLLQQYLVDPSKLV